MKMLNEINTLGKFLLGTLTIYVAVIVLGIIGGLFGIMDLPTASEFLLSLSIVFLFFLPLVQSQKSWFKEKRAKIFKFGGIVFLIAGIIYLMLPFVFGVYVHRNWLFAYWHLF
ncbi:MAG: hypothetical protein CVT88_04520 [Candidatus Altiarchaeales archaeon HGW-Altiarchaeales-1]|nr:MAG: hypothetical protein CVT88_04520 [Candidatus Altiarchaeales archaeon HGW-Altiarchaeales-1]